MWRLWEKDSHGKWELVVSLSGGGYREYRGWKWKRKDRPQGSNEKSCLNGRTRRVNNREMISLQASYVVSERYFPKVDEENGFCCFVFVLYALFHHVREVLP